MATPLRYRHDVCDAPAAPDCDAPAAPEDHVIDALAEALTHAASLRRAAAWDSEAPVPDLYAAVRHVRERQPPPPASAATSQPSLDALVAELRARGAWLAPELRVRATAAGGRVEASAAIAQGAPIVAVPRAAMVRTSDVLDGHPTLGPWLATRPLFGPGALMLWLVVTRFAPPSPAEPWQAYVDALPGDVPDTALAWPRSPGEHLRAAALGRQALAGVLQLYCLAHRRLRATPPPERPLPIAAFTLARWLWAGAILSSRQHAIDGELALVPLWDLLARDEARGAPSAALEGDALVCRAAVPLAPGDMAAMDGGHQTPAERWVTAGVAPPGPPDGPAPALPFPLPPGVALRRDKLLWLLADRDRDPTVPVGAGRLAAAYARARWYALDDAELRRLGLRGVADAWGHPAPLSAAGEARAADLLRAWLGRLAGPAEAPPPFSAAHGQILAAARATYGPLVARERW